MNKIIRSANVANDLNTIPDGVFGSFRPGSILYAELLNNITQDLNNKVVNTTNEIIEYLGLIISDILAIEQRVNEISQQLENIGDDISTGSGVVSAVAVLRSVEYSVFFKDLDCLLPIRVIGDDEIFLNPHAELREDQIWGIRNVDNISHKYNYYYNVSDIEEQLSSYRIYLEDDTEGQVSYETPQDGTPHHYLFKKTYPQDTLYNEDGTPHVVDSTKRKGGITTSADQLKMNHGIKLIDAWANVAAGPESEKVYVANKPTIWDVITKYNTDYKNLVAYRYEDLIWAHNRYIGLPGSDITQTDLKEWGIYTLTDEDMVYPVNHDLYDNCSSTPDAASYRNLNKQIVLLDAGTYKNKITCQVQLLAPGGGSVTTNIYEYEAQGAGIVESDIRNIDRAASLSDINISVSEWDESPQYFAVHPKNDDLLAGLIFVIPGGQRPGCTTVDWNDFCENTQDYIDRVIGKVSWKTYGEFTGEPIAQNGGHFHEIDDNSDNNREHLYNRKLAKELYYSSTLYSDEDFPYVKRGDYAWFGVYGPKYDSYTGINDNAETTYGPLKKYKRQFCLEVYLYKQYETLKEENPLLSKQLLKARFLQDARGPKGETFDNNGQMTIKMKYHGGSVEYTNTVLADDVILYDDVDRSNYATVSRIYVTADSESPRFISDDGITYRKDRSYWYAGPIADHLNCGWDINLDLKEGDILVMLFNPHAKSINTVADIGLGFNTINTNPDSTQNYMETWEGGQQESTTSQIMHASNAITKSLCNVAHENMSVLPHRNMILNYNTNDVDSLTLCYDYVGYSVYGDSTSNPNYVYTKSHTSVRRWQHDANDYQTGILYRDVDEYDEYFNIVINGDNGKEWKKVPINPYTLNVTSSIGYGNLHAVPAGEFQNRYDTQNGLVINNNPDSPRLYKRYGGRDYNLIAYQIGTGGVNLRDLRMYPYGPLE